MLSILRGAFLGLVCLNAVHSAELEYSTVKNADDGQHSLSIGAAPFANYGFNAFGFDGSIPGPTFRVRPGQQLRIELTNDLLASNNKACGNGISYCTAATSNFHTHGLHVTSKGVEDGLDAHGDDIFVALAPGEKTLYHFDIPSNHMGGTHWYHPHHHHATALQAGGGAVGLLIVSDPEGYLPEEYASMEERLLVISGHNLNVLQDMARAAEAGLLENAADTATAAGLDTNVFLVNSQQSPTMTVIANKWYRFRMVFAAVEQSLTLSVAGAGTCSLQLMAKDGVYLETVPRAISSIYLFPGARSDVAVSCSCTTYPCDVTFGSNNAAAAGMGPGARHLNQGMGGQQASVDLMTITITQQNVPLEPTTLPYFHQIVPCYLVNLRTTQDVITGDLQLQGGGRTVRYTNEAGVAQGVSMTYENVHANGGTMRTFTPLATLAVGKVYDWNIDGANAHPLHVHVNPYQITEMPAATYGDGYFAIGDFHDTLMLEQLGDGALKVRTQTDTFTGKVVVHCHILEHEDEGMMGFFEVDGTEGTTWAGAETIDPTCYRGTFSPITEDVTVVQMGVSLQYGTADFTTAKQTSFKTAVAAAAGVDITLVSIDNVTVDVLQSPSGTYVNVGTTIEATTVPTNMTLEVLNENLVAQGLVNGTFRTEPLVVTIARVKSIYVDGPLVTLITDISPGAQVNPAYSLKLGLLLSLFVAFLV